MPAGINYSEAPDGFSIECSTRSAEAFLLIPFATLWSGIVLGSFSGAITRDAFEISSLLFGIFALVASAFLLRDALMSVAGQVCFELQGDTLHYFSGIQPIGKTRAYDWTAIDSVSEQIDSIVKRRKKRWAIYLDGNERAVVGPALSAPHRYFVVQVLNEQLAQRKQRNPHR